MRDERHRRLEFNTTAVIILNNLEHMGYRVVTSGAFVASQATNNNKVGCMCLWCVYGLWFALAVIIQHSFIPHSISVSFGGNGVLILSHIIFLVFLIISH